MRFNEKVEFSRLTVHDGNQQAVKLLSNIILLFYWYTGKYYEVDGNYGWDNQ